MASAIAYLKIRGLIYWEYTSDIFMFDQTIKNTLNGNVGLEYAFGNQFGEQAYFIFFLLLPLKLLLNNNMIFALLLFGSIFYAISGIALFFYLKSSMQIADALLLALNYLLLFGLGYRSLFESIYGFHPDFIAGFCMLLLIIFLLKRQEHERIHKATKVDLAGFGFFYIIFVSLKQEMALLAAIFFLLVYLFDKNQKRFNLILFFISTMIFIIGSAFVFSSETEFNRGNEILIQALIQSIQNEGFNILFKDAVVQYYSYIGLLALTFLAAFFSGRKFNAYIFSMFLVAILKTTFAFITKDYSLFTWHNFPCVVLFAGAIALQLKINIRAKPKIVRFTSCLILLFSMIIFIKYDIAFSANKIEMLKYKSAIIERTSPAIQELKRIIPEDKCVSIPCMTAIEWLDRTYTFYDRGVNKSPRGIADYVVLPKDGRNIAPGIFCLTYCGPQESMKIKNEFLLIKENEYFAAFKRYRFTKKNRKSRVRFNKYFKGSEK